MEDMIDEIIPKKSGKQLKLKTFSIPHNSNSKSLDTQTKKQTKKQTRKDTTTTTSIKSIETVKIKDDMDVSKYTIAPLKSVKPKIWELPNRKRFYNWLHSYYNVYETGNGNKQKTITTNTRELSNIQKLVRDFMQTESPYRGILLYYGLGIGKSCASIAISNAITNKRRVIFMSKASLESNYIEEILKCDGSTDYMRRNHHWVFTRDTEGSTAKHLFETLGIPEETIRFNGGVFLIDHSRADEPNFDKLGSFQTGLMHQLRTQIKNRFKFIHLDDTRITTKLKEGFFDDSIVIIDEAHNLINSMASGTPTGTFFYNNLLNAVNIKLILLSGTPLINTIAESAFLYNILKGVIKTIVYKIVPDFGRPIEWSNIKTRILKNKYVDQVVVNTTKKNIKITMNPHNFITDISGGGGVIYSPKEAIEFEEFKKYIHDEMLKIKDALKFSKFFETIEMNECLPTDNQEFQKLFYNPDLNRMKNTDVFKKRIVGLSSFYDHKDISEYPALKPINLVVLPMSNFQLAKYQTIRIKEIEKERKQARNKRGGDEPLMSSYRIGSRLHCTFVFPDEIGSPYEMDKMDLYENIENILDPTILDGDRDKDKDKTKDGSIDDAELITQKQLYSKYLEVLDKKRSTYMSIEKGGQLGIYSPKYKAIIENLNTAIGCCLLYSQFISLIGLNTFAIALKATNKYAPFILKRVGAEYVLDMPPEDKDKLKYVYFAGDNKDKDLRDIYRAIFSSDFESLPPSCNSIKKQLEEMYGSGLNRRGEIIKLMMATRSGAEGLNLFNVRRVYVMEPYWQPVLIQQVIGRAVRKNSHKMLPLEERNVEVFIYMVSITSEQVKTIASSSIRKDVAKYAVKSYNKVGKVISSDEELYIISERKKEVIEEAQQLIREAAFDCTLNYSDHRTDYPTMVCLNYNTKNRIDYNSYLSTPGIEDTVDIVDVNQEYEIPVEYQKFKNPKDGQIYYFILNPQPGAKRYIYNEDVISKARAKPIGEVFIVDGRKVPRFYKKKSNSSKLKSKSKSKSKSK